MRIVFWGTPDFAVPPLRALLGEGHDVVGVVTQPDRPRGRSRSRLDPSPVKEVAVAEGLPVLQPERPRGEAFEAELRALEPDLNVVVAYGHILPKGVIDMPPQGTLNIHASLLPALRGAAPIQAAILEGHAETGVTIMRMVPALDAGAIVHTLRTPILPDESFGELHDRLAELGALALVQALVLMDAGLAHDVEQDHARATYAGKIEREHARVDWRRPAPAVARVVRAFDPRPGAFATLGGEVVKLYGARVTAADDATIADDALRAAAPGTVRSVDEHGLLVRCGSGALRLEGVQPAGRPRMTPADWRRGRGVTVGDRFDDVAGTEYLAKHDARRGD